MLAALSPIDARPTVAPTPRRTIRDASRSVTRAAHGQAPWALAASQARCRRPLHASATIAPTRTDSTVGDVDAQ